MIFFTALFNYARAHPADVAAVAALIPALGVTAIHDADAELGAEIEAAQSGREGYAAGIAAHDPARHAEELAPLALRAGTQTTIRSSPLRS